MRVLLDTSVLSEGLRRKKTNIYSTNIFLYHLINNEEVLCITGLILQETLSSITNIKLYNQIKEILLKFSYIEPSKEDYLFASEIRNLLKHKGVTTNTVDVLIASLSIRYNLPIATYDKDFDHIAKYTQLKVLKFENYIKEINN